MNAKTREDSTAASDALRARGDAHNSPSYAPSIVLDYGEGVRVFDVDGKEYLDFVAGIAVSSLGHGHPALVAAIARQAERLIHASNMYYSEPQIRLMEELTRRSFADRVFLCNSGTESTEAAMKLARRYQKVVRGESERFEFVSMSKSFHGRTLASITATGQPKYHAGFEPLPAGYSYADFNDLDSVAALVTERTAAIIVEPVQGEGGVKPATQEFLEGVRRLADERGALVIYDEVQTGVARTGTMWAYQGYDVAPDIMCLAKGLGGGVPIGAMLATDEVFRGFEKGSHATTFGGNPLASAAALAVLGVVDAEDLCGNARERGAQLMSGLRRITEGRQGAVEVRGRGLMIGVECEGDGASRVAASCTENGLLVNTAGGNTVRFVPPLVVSAADVDEALDRFAAAVEDAGL